VRCRVGGERRPHVVSGDVNQRDARRIARGEEIGHRGEVLPVGLHRVLRRFVADPEVMRDLVEHDVPDLAA
jgi:hypothetical protein